MCHITLSYVFIPYGSLLPTLHLGPRFPLSRRRGGATTCRILKLNLLDWDKNKPFLRSHKARLPKLDLKGWDIYKRTH